LPWRKRKRNYLAHLRKANEDILIVAVADKLHNARAILSDYRALGKRREELWRRFNAGKKDQLWYYSALVATLRETKAPKVLVSEFERVVNKLTNEAK
jgi:hypothetical protein